MPLRPAAACDHPEGGASLRAAVAAYLVNDEKATNVKFASAGIAVPPPAPPDPRDPFAPVPPRQNNVLIVFAKK